METVITCAIIFKSQKFKELIAIFATQEQYKLVLLH